MVLVLVSSQTLQRLGAKQIGDLSISCAGGVLHLEKDLSRIPAGMSECGQLRAFMQCICLSSATSQTGLGQAKVPLVWAHTQTAEKHQH